MVHNRGPSAGRANRMLRVTRDQNVTIAIMSSLLAGRASRPG